MKKKCSISSSASKMKSYKIEEKEQEESTELGFNEYIKLGIVSLLWCTCFSAVLTLFFNPERP